jgi:malate permease and related proteins
MTALINSLPFLLSVLIVKIGQRLGFVKEKDSDAIVRLLLNLVVPALIIVLLKDVKIGFSDLRFILMALIAWFLSGFVGVLLSKFLKLSRVQEGALVIGFLSFSVGLIVYPFVELNYSAFTFAKVVFYDLAGLFPLLMTLTYGVAIFYGEGKGFKLGDIVKKTIFSPIVISMFIGIAASLFSFKNEFIESTLTYISSSFGFLAAALLGLSLSLPAKEGFLKTVVGTLVKFFSGVLIGFVITFAFDISGELQKGIVIATTSPFSLTTLIFAKTEKLDLKFLSQLVSFSIIFYLIALPILMLFL